MLTYLPFKPTKGEAFRLYFSIADIDANNPDANGASLKRDFISKNGGTFDECTNTRVHITPDPAQGDYETRAHFYIDLTATEMNADVIVYRAYANITCTAPTIVIHTTTGSDSGALTLETEITNGYTVGDLFNLFTRRLKRNNQKI